MTAELLDDHLAVGRARLRQIFRFLKDFNAVKNPVRRQIAEHSWVLWLRELPDHPCIWRRRAPAETGSDDRDITQVIRVRRPSIPSVPTPHSTLDGWLPQGWNDPSIRDLEPISERTIVSARPIVVEKFGDDQARSQAWRDWKELRDAWAPQATIARQVMEVFNRLFSLQGRLEREGEGVQLLLGQGILVWRRDDGDIRHPIVAQRLELSFDPYVPEFTIAETGQSAELVRSLLIVDYANAARTIQQIDDELTSQDIDLLHGDALEGPLRRLVAVLHAEGSYRRDSSVAAASFPQIYCDPVIYLVRRNEGFAASVDHVLEDLQRTAQIPVGLLRISGIEQAMEDVRGEAPRPSWEEPTEILFTKEANDEQVRIAERLGRHSNVLVQGPPGTGKTHTIANLIGHLLAQGKRVLVTAHTSKALRVLRDKVVEPLQTLCVSVLDSEIESRKQLEASVDAMVARLSSDDPHQLDEEADIAERERTRLVSELSKLQRALIAARQDEYRDIIIGGAATQPSEAARFVALSTDANAWIQGPVEPGMPAPLSEQEAQELYATNSTIQVEDEVELKRWRPPVGTLPGASEFAGAVETWHELQLADRATGAKLWTETLYDASVDELQSIQSRIRHSVDLLSDLPLWKLDAIAAGLPDRETAGAPWTDLSSRLEALRRDAHTHLSLLFDNRCDLDEVLSLTDQRVRAREIYEFLQAGGKLSPLRLVAKPQWRKFVASVRVNDRPPATAQEFLALETAASLASARAALGNRWNNQVTRRGGPTWNDFGTTPEENAALYVPQIRALLTWHERELSPLVRELSLAGFAWDDFVNSLEITAGEHAELRRLVVGVTKRLPPIIAARIALLQLKALDMQFQKWHRALFSPDVELLPSSAVLDLRTAIERKDRAAYDLASRELIRLESLFPGFQRRQILLRRAREMAPEWAAAVQDRRGQHGGAVPPGSIAMAWQWRQFMQELERRSRVSISELQGKIEFTRHELREVTSRLIELRAWSAQCKRVGLEERQALQGWKDIVRRIGRGTGVRAPGLRAEARRTLSRARDAVPVWIMPLARVAETFDARVARFDVVIVDEASQCDVMGLLALYLANQAVVVGDHEQVSPLAVGQEIAEVQRLIEQHLEGIPNSALYDGKMSLYDLARQSFGGVIRLVEHFRCMPEIIAFSNNLSYNGAIKPLRDPSSSTVQPAVVAYRVDGTRTRGKVNPDEAYSIVALVRAIIEQPEYAGKSIGVVSLVGEEQAVYVETLAREKLSPSELYERQFLTGTAAQFQGDERDIVFLSMVDSPGDGPLAKRDVDLFRQRFNVAASRPKDQLWVIHSLDPKRDLQPGDLRRRLIEHAEDPSALDREYEQEGLTESEFEKLVLRRLLEARYLVTPQWRVGRYRIDLVVRGNGRRLAVECDGDRYHPLEKIAEDMARQAVLERLGWQFVRIRGTEFFRDPDTAIGPVFQKLRALGVHPTEEKDQIIRLPSDLVDRVKRAAAATMVEWKAQRLSTEA